MATSSGVALRPVEGWTHTFLGVSLATLIVSGGGIEEAFGITSGYTILNTICAAALVLAIWTRPKSTFVLPVGVLLVLFVLLWCVSSLRYGLPVTPERSLQALFGLVLPWLAFGINLQGKTRRWLLKAVALCGTASVLVSVVFQFARGVPLLREEYTGVVRLAGMMSWAYIGFLGAIGVVAACVLWSEGSWQIAPLMIVSNLGIAYLSGTRGPQILAVFVLTATLISGQQLSRWRTMSGYRLMVAMSAAGGLAMAIRVIERTQLASAYGRGDSGRGAAWQYFFERFQDHPLLGNGLGASYTLGALSDDVKVRNGFLAPHNIYIQLVVDGGLLLGVPLIVCVLWIFSRLMLQTTPLTPLAEPIATSADARAMFAPIAPATAVGGRIMFASLAPAKQLQGKRTRPNTVYQRDLIAIAVGVGLALFAFVDNFLNVPQCSVTSALVIAALLKPASSKPVLTRQNPTLQNVNSEDIHG